MAKRILTAVLLIPLVLGLLWAGQWGFLTLWLLCGALMAWEYGTALQWPIVGRTLFGIWHILLYLMGIDLVPPKALLVFSFVLLGGWLWHMHPEKAFQRVYQVAFGALYLGVGWGSVGWHFGTKAPYAAEAILGYLLPVWASDTVAYFVGRAWGRHKIRPRLSPQKSWEGLLGGIVAAAIVGHWSVPWTGDFQEVPGAFVGGVAAIVGFLGDVWESAWKRYHGLKDAGSLLPGHGGLLDRLDALLWISPLWWGLSRL